MIYTCRMILEKRWLHDKERDKDDENAVFLIFLYLGVENEVQLKEQIVLILFGCEADLEKGFLGYLISFNSKAPVPIPYAGQDFYV